MSALQSVWVKSLAGLALRWRFTGTVQAHRCCLWCRNWPTEASENGTAWCVVFSAMAGRGVCMAWTATLSTSGCWWNLSLEQNAPPWLENPNCFSSRPARAKSIRELSTWTVTGLNTVILTPTLSKSKTAFRLMQISYWEWPQFPILCLSERRKMEHGIFSHCARTLLIWCRG